MAKRAHQRTELAAASSILICALITFVLLPVGLATFEIWRYIVARAQLQYICDAAALCATANLLRQSTDAVTQANSGSLSGAWGCIEEQAIQSAASMFNQNSVLSKPLKQTQIVENALLPSSATVSPERTKLWVALVNSQQQQVFPGQSGAKGVRISAQYGYQTFCGSYLGLACLPITVTSEGGIPPIDLVLCFDVSASMDDGTAVTMVKRFWDGKQVSHYVPAAGTGTLLDIVKPVTDGTRVNAVGPENLSALASPLNGTQLVFSESSGSPFKGLRALGGSTQQSEVGRPPGNYGAAQAGNGPGQALNLVTDVVTNLDGNAQFGGWTDPATGLQFPNIETLVEASRGNLNSQAAMQQALVTGGTRPAWLPATAPNPNYQQVYFTRANQVVQPMATAKTAAIEILRSLNRSTDLNSGLVSFSDYIGQTPLSTWGTGPGATTYFVDSNWPPGGTGAYPLPLLKLNATNPNVVGKLPDWLRIDRWFCQPAYAQAPPPVPINTMVQLISSFVATGKSNIASALAEAIAELTDPARSRPDAEKIILLISDGQPDLPGGGGGANSPAAQACYDQAVIADKQGIKIIAVDVATTGNTDGWQFLSKTAALTKGFCAQGTSPAQLNLVLKKIVTQLVTLR